MNSVTIIINSTYTNIIYLFVYFFTCMLLIFLHKLLVRNNSSTEAKTKMDKEIVIDSYTFILTTDCRERKVSVCINLFAQYLNHAENLDVSKLISLLFCYEIKHKFAYVQFINR